MKLWFVLLLWAFSIAFTFFLTEQSCSRAQATFQQANLARASDRAELAYFTQPLPIARWELEEFDALVARENYGLSAGDKKSTLMYRFTTRARLAKVYRELQDVERSQQYLELALEAGKELGAPLNDAKEVLELLAKMDEPRKVQFNGN